MLLASIIFVGVVGLIALMEGGNTNAAVSRFCNLEYRENIHKEYRFYC